MSKTYKVKNWHEFQHFKDRNPPWIKLHRSILERRDISAISDCSFRLLIMLWVLASEDKHKDGGLPSVDDIAFRTRLPKQRVVNGLEELKDFLIQSDIAVISNGYRGDVPETETETEGEKETKKEEETKKVAKNKFGELQKVSLTEEEHGKLKESYGDKFASAIEILDAYIATNNKKYASHYAVMKKGGWVWDKVFTVTTLRNPSTRVSFADQKPASYFRGKEEVKLEF